MKRSWQIAWVGCWLGGVFPPLMHAQSSVRETAPGFVMVVNTANPLNTISRADLERYFLKYATHWPNGTTVTVIDQPPNSATRVAFSKAVLEQSVSTVQAYWQQRIFSGHTFPPLSKTDDTEVLNVVKTDMNAIGYIDPRTPLPAGVKVLSIPER